MSGENSVDATRERLQHESFNYLLHETSPANGLVLDKNEANWPVSVAATGLALAAYPVAVEREFNPRLAAGRRLVPHKYVAKVWQARVELSRRP
jgi:hypothetical protein